MYDKNREINGYSLDQILKDAWLNIVVKEETLFNPLLSQPYEAAERPELYYSWLLTRPEYLGFAAKILLNIELAPFQTVILQEMWNHKFPIVVASRGGSKTFSMAVYSLLRALLIPKRKVVIVGSVFRQSKLVFNYIKEIYDNAPVLRSIINDEPHFSNDRCFMHLGNSKITALPVGNTGDKIRGERATEIIADEFACLSEKTIIQTQKGLMKIEDYLKGDIIPLLNKDGEFETPDKIFKTPLVDVYRIKTEYGLYFDCSEIHQCMESQGWKKTLDLKVGDYIKVVNNNYFPEEKVKSITGEVLNEKLSFLMGLLISDTVSTDEWKESFIDNINENYSTDLKTTLIDLGLKYRKEEDKEIPKGILQSPKECILSFLKSLYTNDGKIVNGKNAFYITYQSNSRLLCEQLQQLLLKFNIFSSLFDKRPEDSFYTVKVVSNNAIKLYNILNLEIWKDHSIPKPVKKEKKPMIVQKNGVFNLSTSFLGKKKNLGSYSSVEECQAAFDDFYKNEEEYLIIKSIEKLPEKQHLYDFHLPNTHSFVGNGFVQHNSQSKEIFETVIAGFGAVSSDPVSKVKAVASEKFAKLIGIELEKDEDQYSTTGNQIILSGTAYYHFNHFAQYWEKWREIIRSKGEPKKLQALFGEQEVDASFNWKDYSVVRIPADLLPPGFMDESQLARSRATLPSDTYALEFSAIFSKDSNGFFKASLIDKCTANEDNEITHNNGKIIFEAKVKGDKDKRYVFGVDPASEQDKFAIVVIELHEDHRRIVHCWTTNTEEFKQKRKKGIIEENDFYGYTARKIRDLMILFPCVHLAIDSQGGGKAVYEALHDRTRVKPGEHPLWEIIEDDKHKDSDGEEGLHIVEMVNFASADYTSTANHTMKKDFEDKTLLFPRFNPAVSAFAASMAEINGKNLYDTFEDCLEEIEELKKELSQIVITVTASGRERWDTPDVKISGSEKGKLRKDRYSALVMANAAARKISGPNYIPRHDVFGLLNKQEEDNKNNFIGPAWATSKLNDLY